MNFYHQFVVKYLKEMFNPMYESYLKDLMLSKIMKVKKEKKNRKLAFEFKTNSEFIFQVIIFTKWHLDNAKKNKFN